MRQNQTSIPAIWLLSDARNDARLENALAALPRGSGFVFRHYHLPMDERRARFDTLAAIARRKGHVVIVSGPPALARRWRADGTYGPPTRFGCSCDHLRLATAHDATQVAAANNAGADAILLSPVFPTASHPGARTLGTLRFRQLALKAKAPVIALGGMTPLTAKRLGWLRWAAIDGLVYSAPTPVGS